MALTATPYGLVPLNIVGGQSNTGGTIRQYRMTTNFATAIYKGDLIALGVAAAGQPTALTATPTTSTVGLVGVCVGVQYVDPVLKYVVHSNFLPANAVTAGYTNIFVNAIDDPDQLYQVQASGQVPVTAIGKNAPLGNFGGSAATGNSSITLTAVSVASTGTLGVRIIDLVNSTSTFGGNLSQPNDAFTDCIVRLNFGVHTYQQSAGTTN